MPFWMESDTFADDPLWSALAQGDLDRRDRLQAAWCRLKAKSSHVRSDGYLTRDLALRYVRNPRDLERLTTSVLGRPARLHLPDHDCDCLGEDWVPGYDLRIHRFLRRNPSKAEYERNRAQKSELRDPRLRLAVYRRDGGCCRYCRSGPLSPKAGRARDRRKALQLDHVDPDATAGVGAANLVTACGRCNEHKGHRTPEEADMVLLPEPTPADAARWLTEDLALFDAGQLRDQTRNSLAIRRGTETGSEHGSNTEFDSDSDPQGDPGDVSTGPVWPLNRPYTSNQSATRLGNPSPQGWVGAAGSGPSRHPSAQPLRTPADPDVYTRRSRIPDFPPHRWPAGSVPATPPEDDDD